MNPPTVAAVIPVFNRSQAVIEAMESVAAQTQAPAKLVVVDDGSTDGTADRAEEWIARRQPAFEARVIRQANQGAAAARNRGAAEASGCDVLAFLDSDDLWPKDYLQRVSDGFGRNPDAVAAACDRVNIDFATNKSNPHSYAHYENGDRNPATIIFLDGPPGTSGAAFRASAFHKIGGYDPRWPTGQDYDLMLRLSLLGRWIHLSGDPITSRNHLERVKGAGEPPLSRKYADRSFRRVQMLDRFIHEAGGAAVVPERLWRARLVRLWLKAGRKLVELDRREDARHCFHRTLELRPRNLSARWCLWRTRGD